MLVLFRRKKMDRLGQKKKQKKKDSGGRKKAQ